MAPRKKQYDSGADRIKAFRERQRATGKKQIGLWLSEEAIEILDRLAEAKGEDRSAVAESLILAKRPRKR